MPFATDRVIKVAMRKLGWLQRVSAWRVQEIVVPVVDVGDAVQKFVTISGSGGALGALVFAALTNGQVPAGKQWRVVTFAAAGATAGVYPGMSSPDVVLNLPAGQGVQIHTTASTIGTTTMNRYPQVTDANPVAPLALLKAGDQLGVCGASNGLTSGWFANAQIIEEDAPD